MQSHLRALLAEAIEKTAKGGELNSTELPPLILEPPKQREFGDLATNVAMLWAKSAKKSPRVIAELILKNIEDPEGILARKEIAGPGFLNFAFSRKFYFQRLRELAEGKESQIDLGHGEKVLRERNEVAQTMELLRSRDLLYSEGGAEWFKSTRFGDDKDRTVLKSDGEPTYFASDIAYHRNKFERGFGKLINVWGADHHGYVTRLKAAMQGLGYDPNKLNVV